LHRYYPEAQLDFMLRKGNEGLLKEHPYIHQVLIWNKKEGKMRSMRQLIRKMRIEKYDLLVNLQRFGATGWMTFRSGARIKAGFDKNPFSFCYQRSFRHRIGNGKHEVNRNLELTEEWTDDHDEPPRLHISAKVMASVAHLKESAYVTMAPTSVWFTKQMPSHKWVGLIRRIRSPKKIYLLGAPADHEACEQIRNESRDERVVNLCGELSLLASTGLMKDAAMNYVNDSAPMHFASAVNAPTTAFFCSTVPDFGFGPLADESRVIEVKESLECRPCGLHGFKACPKGHFKCANDIPLDEI